MKRKINYKRLYKFEKEITEESDRKYWRLKKRFDFWFPLGIIALTFLIVGLLYAFTSAGSNILKSSNWNNDYKITIQECNNVTETSVGYYPCIIGCNYNNGTNNCEKYCSKIFILNNTKCVEKEVDEITILLEPNFVKFNNVSCEDYRDIYFYKEKVYFSEGDCGYNRTCCFFTGHIQKSDLTKEWIDENCNIKEMCNNEMCIELEQGTEITDFNFKNAKDKSYKCGEYTVEVI